MRTHFSHVLLFLISQLALINNFTCTDGVVNLPRQLPSFKWAVGGF